MKLSIVATLYQSAPYIIEFYERVSAASQRLTNGDYEIVFVNDGSFDNSLDLAVKLSEKDTHVVVIDLSRNFGHHKAIMTGLEHTKGESIFLIDADLEESPEWITSFSTHMLEGSNLDVVFGVQSARKGGVFERFSGKLFWMLINGLSGLSLPANIVTARLMSRRYVDALLLHKEREVFLAGLWQITGFKQKSIIVNKHNKQSTTYTLGRKLSLLINSVTSFSVFPLVAIFYTGLTIFLFACCYTAYLVINWLFFSYTMVGWTSLMVSIWLLGGLILSSIGVIGLYLSKVFSESKQRPYTIVREVYGRQ